MRAVRTRRAVGCVLAGCVVVLAGCDSKVPGRGTLADGPAPAVPTPTASASATSSATPSAAPSTSPPVTSSPPSNKIPTVFAGTWTGNMNQPGSVLPHWAAVLVLPQGRSTGTFTVAGFCRGVVTVQVANQTVVRGLEVINSDPNNKCAASGTFVLQRTGTNRASLRWVDSDHPDNTASGTLTRG